MRNRVIGVLQAQAEFEAGAAADQIRNCAEAVRQFQIAGTAGNASGCFPLRLLSANGQGVCQDRARTTVL